MRPNQILKLPHSKGKQNKTKKNGYLQKERKYLEIM